MRFLGFVALCLTVWGALSRPAAAADHARVRDEDSSPCGTRAACRQEYPFSPPRNPITRQQERLLLNPPTAQCDLPSQRAALLALFNNTGGAAWTSRTGWPAPFSSPTDLATYLATAPIQSGACNVTAAVSVALTSAAALTLPDHCCWHGVGCDSAGQLTALSLGVNGVSEFQHSTAAWQSKHSDRHPSCSRQAIW